MDIEEKEEGVQQIDSKNQIMTDAEGQTLVVENDQTTLINEQEDGVTTEDQNIVEESQSEAVVEENIDTNLVETPIPQEEKKGKRKKRRKKRKKIDEYSLTNDIRYRGPLSYRTLRIVAWLCLIISQVGALLSLGVKLDEGLASKIGGLPVYMEMLKNLMMPLFLIATFGTILNRSRSFKSMLMLYGGAAVLFYILFILFHNYYIPAVISFFMEIDKESAVLIMDSLLMRVVQDGYLAFNIFLDLFLCTLLVFFLTYEPKKVFTGKKVIIFRLFSLLPILYEIASFIVKLYGALGKLVLSPYIYPLLTTKPPMIFLVFVAIALFIKAREGIYRRRGKTHEQYQEFLGTRANSWQFAKFTSRMMVIAGVIDVILYGVLTVVIAGKGLSLDATEDAAAAALSMAANAMVKTGIGGSSVLILAAPFIMLFSYTRTHKKKTFDILLPLFAIIALIFVYLQGIVVATDLIGSFSKLMERLMG